MVVASELREVKGGEVAEDDGVGAKVLPRLLEEAVVDVEELGVLKAAIRLNASSGSRRRLPSSSTRRLFKAMEVVESIVRPTATYCTARGVRP